MERENPCNICSGKNCDHCILNCESVDVYECSAHRCMLNCDGSCIMNFYDGCGLREEVVE